VYFVLVSIFCVNTSQMHYSYLVHDHTAAVTKPCLGQLFCYYLVGRVSCFIADLSRFAMLTVYWLQYFCEISVNCSLCIFVILSLLSLYVVFLLSFTIQLLSSCH